MIMKTPCAEERISRLVSFSTNSEPEMLKKSNATPYTTIERIRNAAPEPGLPMPKNPKRSTHASIEISITFLMPKRRRKNGMSRMQNVSDICESDSRITECFTIAESAYCGIDPKF